MLSNYAVFTPLLVKSQAQSEVDTGLLCANTHPRDWQKVLGFPYGAIPHGRAPGFPNFINIRHLF